MSKFNQTQSLGQALANRPDAIQNHAGGLAFKMSPEVELYTTVATCFVLESKYYEKGSDNFKRIKELVKAVAQINPIFVLKLASYTRQVLNLRSVSTMLLVEASNINECKPFVKAYAPKIVQRADEITEALAYQLNNYGRPIPNSLKKGLAIAFSNFDEYQMAKYNRDGAITFSDSLRLIHPTPVSTEQNALFNFLRTGEINHPELTPKLKAKADLMAKESLDEEAIELANKASVTWEVLTSKFGSGREVWETVLPMMGYMAKLRNLRNFIQKGVDITPVLQHITNPKAVANSKQLPFRFFSAFREIEEMQYERTTDPIVLQKVKDALNSALNVSVDNIPQVGGRTFLTADNSGSMSSYLSAKSKVRCVEVADLFMAIAHKAWSKGGDVITSVFGQEFAVVPASAHDSVITNMKMFQNTAVGHSTNAYLSVKYLVDNKIPVDRIVIFSDMQCYETTPRQGGLAYQVEKYRQTVNPNVYVYSFDLQGYGQSVIPPNSKNTCLLAGFSDKVLNFIPLFEQDGESAVARIVAEF